MISRRLARLPALLEAPDLVLDPLFAEALVVEGVPCVHDQPDTPEDDREDRPEEALPGHRPDPDDEAVYQGEDQQVGVEVAALLQPLDRPVANRDITIVARGFAARHRRHPLSSLTLRRRGTAAKCHWSPAHDGTTRTGAASIGARRGSARLRGRLLRSFRHGRSSLADLLASTPGGSLRGSTQHR